MAYALVDDRFHTNPKILSVGLAGAGLYAKALSYCSDYLTDGHIPAAWVELQCGTGHQDLPDTLIEARLWRRTKNGYVIPDYLDYNPPREYVEAKRSELSAKRAAAGLKGAQKRWQKWQTDGKQDGKPIATGMATEWPPIPLTPHPELQDQEPPQEQTPSQVQSVARPPSDDDDAQPDAAAPKETGPDRTETEIDLTHYWEQRQRALTETEAALKQLNYQPPAQEQP